MMKVTRGRSATVYLNKEELQDWKTSPSFERRAFLETVARQNRRNRVRVSSGGRQIEIYEREPMQANPRRPPKKWMRDCVRGAGRSSRDPGAVCGALWYHKMSPSSKRAALARERKELAENPSSGLWLLGGLVVGGAALYFLTREKPAAAATGPLPPAPAPLPLPPAVACVVDQLKLTQWGFTAGVVALLIPTSFPNDTPPMPNELKAMLPPAMQAQLDGLSSGQAVVVVLQDNTFWYYANDQSAPQRRPDLFADYCNKFGASTVQGHPANYFMII
jgi:hypothetical protein